MSMLFDSVYIHNGGGKTLLDWIIEYIIQHGMERRIHFLLDKRYPLSTQFDAKLSYSFLSPTESDRREFYKSNSFCYYFCFSNVPPPVSVSSRNTSIYFQNELFFNPLATELPIAHKIKNICKKYYIKYRLNKVQEWCVQTQAMKDNLNRFLGVSRDKIHVYPIFDSEKNEYSRDKDKNTFLYVCNPSKHKNHKRLMDAFIHAAGLVSQQLKLRVTFSCQEFEQSEYNRQRTPKNLEIINVGLLDKKEIAQVYARSQCLIYPSLNESLGLPLIEAVNAGCVIIAANKRYVKEVVKPSLFFDPYSVESIAQAIRHATAAKELSPSELLIENKMDKFMEYLLSHV